MSLQITRKDNDSKAKLNDNSKTCSANSKMYNKNYGQTEKYITRKNNDSETKMIT